MENKAVSEPFNNINDLEQLTKVWAQNTKEGFMVSRQDNIIYINNQFIALLNIDKDSIPQSVKELLSEEEINLLLNSREILYKKNKKYLQISATITEAYTFFLVNDITQVEELKKKTNEIKQLNKELQTVYEEYADDTIFITDGKGKVEFIGKMIAANCGVSQSEMIGKSVYELEKERVFYPSVTVKVLESRQSEALIQNTKKGRQFVSVGTPIFNEKGEITKVISITKDYTRQIKIGTMLSRTEEEKKIIPHPDTYLGNIVTCNEKMLYMLGLVKLLAKVNSTVLIYGETGTGKEMVARYIHKTSARTDKPFIKVNCGAIAPNLVESELFGYEPGSFTGANKNGKIGLIEAANEGILFLDEISELPLNQQVKLLQVLQENSMTKVGGTKTIDLNIRVIAATNKKLEDQVQKCEFREDLFYRLNVVPINLPPLRDRTDDIPLLIAHFLKFNNTKYGTEKQFTKDAFKCLCNYSWPGNIRELENTVERLVITSNNTFIEFEDLPDNLINELNSKNDLIIIKDILNINEATEELEKKLILMAMKQYGNGSKAAAALGINQSTISRKMKYYKITT